jgi:maltose alpha-D-glucosyltransferase/alpha-amylase
VFDAFAPEPSMQLYDRGIRRRLAPMLDADRRRLELAYSMAFSLPGSPVIRYGDEIGMGDDLDLPERQAARTPMQWSSEPHGGFSTAKKTVSPVIGKGPFGFAHVNVADQRRDPQSFMNWTERMIRMRKQVPEIGWGDFKIIDAGTQSVLVLRYDWRGSAVVVVHNFDSRPRSAAFGAGDERGRRLVNLLTQNHSEADGSGRHRLELEPYAYRWYRVGGLDDLLIRRQS